MFARLGGWEPLQCGQQPAPRGLGRRGAIARAERPSVKTQLLNTLFTTFYYVLVLIYEGDRYDRIDLANNTPFKSARSGCTIQLNHVLPGMRLLWWSTMCARLHPPTRSLTLPYNRTLTPTATRAREGATSGLLRSRGDR